MNAHLYFSFAQTHLMLRWRDSSPLILGAVSVFLRKRASQNFFHTCNSTPCFLFFFFLSPLTPQYILFCSTQNRNVFCSLCATVVKRECSAPKKRNH